MDKLYLATSKPRKQFKKLLGQSNHFLITALIGLDYIKKNDVSLPDDFSTSWNPKDKIRSVMRTREYILNSSLAWAVDCLDSYLSACNQKPKIFSDEELLLAIQRAERSVDKKFNALADYVKTIKKGDFELEYDLYVSLSELAIQWRNNTIHYNANNAFDKKFRDVLINSSEKVNKLFCGLSVEDMLDRFNNKKSPTFKDVTSLIKGIQKFVELSDICLLSRLDIKNYAKEVVECFFSKNTKEKILFSTLEEDRRTTKLFNILKDYSFTEVLPSEDSKFVKLSELIK